MPKAHETTALCQTTNYVYTPSVHLAATVKLLEALNVTLENIEYLKCNIDVQEQH